MTVPNPSPVSPPTSEARHTPGPWKIDGYSRQGETRIVAPFKPTCTYQIALVSPDVPDDATRDANARLIAAAPALLAACEALMNTGLICTSGKTADGRPCNCTCDVHPELLAVIDYARSAIAAARGGIA